MAKRKRRGFTEEFKAQAVRVVRGRGKSIGVVARELDLTESALRAWVRQAAIAAGRWRSPGPGSMPGGRARRPRARRPTSALCLRLQRLQRAGLGADVMADGGQPRGSEGGGRSCCLRSFSAILTKVRAANPDVLGGATRFEDAVAITRQMKALNVNPRMYGLTVGVDLPKFYEALGRDAEFVYGSTLWVPELVELRAGGLIPIARQYPGAREFVESYKKEFPGADLSLHSAGGYGGCQILVEAVRRAGSLDSEKLRDAILKMDHNTVFGGFRVDRGGLQIAHKMLLFQWQDGKKAIVWPEELAPGRARFPTPPWSPRP